ncbi:hypothetical protein OZ832_002588 [Yersinia enterocolitica]|nr:hypothetical protein [Yersinia enterocolitica]HDP4961870.1 hypothetical protein [Escherichia coli]
MSKKMEKIEDRVLYHQKQLTLLKQKKKQVAAKDKKEERKERVSKFIKVGASVAKVLNMDYREIDANLSKIIGLLEITKQHINDSRIFEKGENILNSWDGDDK